MRIRQVTTWVSKALTRWEYSFRRIEGPELEPFPWHSHYLTGRFSQHCLATLGQKLKGKVLDVGAGTGHGGRYLNKNITKYYATDLPTVTNRLNKRISLNIEKIRTYCSCYALPFVDDCMEGVILISVLEHLENPQLALSEAYRVTIKGGNLLIFTPFAFPVHGHPLDFRRWTLEGLKLEMKKSGFEVVDEVSIGNAFASLALNLNLLLRYNLQQSHCKLLKSIMKLVTPFLMLLQLIFNLLALLFGPLDRSKSFPLGVAILGRKENKIG
jgi:SAM-dependent methyltransferase